ncbi:MAG: glyoxalase superfamily protein [Sulfitobacter sp.]
MTDLPSRDALKTQAKRLRADMKTKGMEITHAAALEMVAHQWGMRDWNTLVAKTDTTPVQWHPGQRVSGQYLGHTFRGMIKSARRASAGFWSLTVRFDTPVDVVKSQHFTSLRRQVSATINAAGTSPQKTSNGQPHMVISPM